MKYKFNCQIAVQKIAVLKDLKEKMDEERKRDIAAASKIKKILEDLIVEAYETFNTDQMALRKEISKEKSFSYVGKFNKYGLARACKGTESKRNSQHGAENRNYTELNTVLINEEGEVVAPRLHEGISSSISSFSEGLAVVTERRKIDESKYEITCYYIDEKGERIDDKTYKSAQEYLFGQALVQYEGDYQKKIFHVIDREGVEFRKITLGEHEDMRWSEKGYLGLHKSQFGAWYIKPNGERLPKDRTQFWDELGDLNKGIAKVLHREGVYNYEYRKDPHYYFINQDGERLTRGIFSQDFSLATDFIDEHAFVIIRDDKKQYLIDKKGNVKKAFEKEKYGEFQKFHGERIIFCKNNYSKDRIDLMTDLEGNIISEGYKDIASFGEGMAFACGESKQIHFSDRDGKSWSSSQAEYSLFTEDGEIIEPEVIINHAGVFMEGVARVSAYNEYHEDEYFYIDKKGKRVFE